MSRHGFIITLVFLTFVLLSCKKELKRYTISEELLKYVYFKEGSQWIYRNETTGVFDTCVLLTDPTSHVSNRYEEEGYVNDEIMVRFYSSFLIYADIEATPDYDFVRYYCPEGSEPYSLRTNVSVGEKINDKLSNSTYTTIGVYDIFPMNDTVFHFVTNTRTAQYFNSVDSIVCQFYFCRNIGLIKYERKISGNVESWTLVKWKVFQ
jgi:hypothetical protein